MRGDGTNVFFLDWFQMQETEIVGTNYLFSNAILKLLGDIRAGPVTRRSHGVTNDYLMSALHFLVSAWLISVHCGNWYLPKSIFSGVPSKCLNIM